MIESRNNEFHEKTLEPVFPDINTSTKRDIIKYCKEYCLFKIDNDKQENSYESKQCLVSITWIILLEKFIDCLIDIRDKRIQ